MKKSVFLMLVSLSISQSTFAHICDRYTTQTDISQCAIREMKKADARLGTVYNNYMKKLSPANKAHLKQNEIAWIKRKEQTCRNEGEEYAGGSMQGMIIAMCLEKKANERVNELHQMMKK